MKTIPIPGGVVELHEGGLTVTRYPGLLGIPVLAQQTVAYFERALALGYGGDTARMSRDHELAHHLLARALGLPHSPTLYGVASGQEWPHWRLEEAAVLALQAYALAAGADIVAIMEAAE
jgi:hypothetical protein